MQNTTHPVFPNDEALPAFYGEVRTELQSLLSESDKPEEEMTVITVPVENKVPERAAWYVAGYLAARIEADGLGPWSVSVDRADREVNFVFTLPSA